MKKNHVILCLVMLFICCALGCGGSREVEDGTWPDSGLGSMLPEPDAKKIHIGYNLDDSFSADIKNAKKEDFTAYVTKCEESGFIVDVDSDSDDYTAYNEEGYKLSISFYDSMEYVSIMLSTPKVNGTFSWPTIGLATLLPIPNTNVGTISIDSSIQFNAFIGETSYDDYKTYVNQCIEKGFNVDYSNGEKVFSADNEEGISLRLEYQGFDTMCISMHAPDDIENESGDIEDKTENTEKMEADDATESEVASPEEKEEIVIEEDKVTEEDVNLVDGMRPEFKEAMDSYETFMNEYCDFMKKYMESPTDLDLLSDYTDYLAQYTETMEKLDAIDQNELSDAELKYYLEVTGRVTQRLSDVAIQ